MKDEEKKAQGNEQYYGGGSSDWNKQQEQQDKINQSEKLLERLDETKKLPANFNYGRGAGLQLAAIERDLFTDQKEQKTGNAVVSGISTKVNEYDFIAFFVGISKILFNQSYQSGNADTNTGLAKMDAIRYKGNTYYAGTVVATLNDICREAYGTDKPSTEQRRAIANLLDILDKNKVHIDYPNGDKQDAKLCATMNKYTRAADGSTTYHLTLNYLLTDLLSKGFGSLPQNTTKLLEQHTKRKSAAHLHLLTTLGQQDKRKPFVRTIDQLLIDMCIEGEYYANPSRTQEKIVKIITDIKKMGAITHCDLDYLPNTKKKRLAKLTFHFNKSFWETK